MPAHANPQTEALTASLQAPFAHQATSQNEPSSYRTNGARPDPMGSAHRMGRPPGSAPAGPVLATRRPAIREQNAPFWKWSFSEVPAKSLIPKGAENGGFRVQSCHRIPRHLSTGSGVPGRLSRSPRPVPGPFRWLRLTLGVPQGPDGGCKNCYHPHRISALSGVQGTIG